MRKQFASYPEHHRVNVEGQIRETFDLSEDRTMTELIVFLDHDECWVGDILDEWEERGIPFRQSHSCTTGWDCYEICDRAMYDLAEEIHEKHRKDPEQRRQSQAKRLARRNAERAAILDAISACKQAPPAEDKVRKIAEIIGSDADAEKSGD